MGGTARQVVLFDFDGTLADTMGTIVEVATTVLLEWGRAPEELGDVSRLVGPPFPQAFCEVYGLSWDEALDVTERYRRIYTRKGAEAWPVFDGVAPLLGELHAAGRRLGVVSSKRVDLVRRGLADNGLEDLFVLCLGRTSDDGSKAELIGEALRMLGVEADDAIYVGDRHYDVEAAHAAGVPCLGVLYGQTAPAGELEEAGAELVCATVADLRQALLG